MANNKVSTTIGKYQVLSILGRGSMGVVYKAQDPEIGRLVAIKTLRKLPASSGHDTSSSLERFRLEARSAGGLRHPNIIAIFDLNIEGDMPYIVMDYVEGETLDRIIAKNGVIAPTLMVHYLAQIGSGLDYAHAKGVLHRDIKPSNVLVDSAQTVFILDFGIAEISLEGEEKTPGKHVMGTPGYMSPEQILNHKLDHRSDLFSLGVLAFECVTGQRPFPGDSFAAVASSILSGTPLALRALSPELPEQLEMEFMKALAKNPDERFGSAAEMLACFRVAVGMDRHGSIPGNFSATRKRRPSRWKSFAVEDEAPEGKRNFAYGREGEGGDLLPAKPAQEQVSSTGTGWKHSLPGDMFSHDTSTLGGFVLRKPRLSTMRMLTVAFASGCLFLSGYLFWIVNHPSTDSSQVVEVLPSLPELPDSFLPLPSFEPLVEGKLVEEMSDKELLGVIMSREASEEMVLNALRQAKSRKIAFLVEATQIPLESDSYLIRKETAKVLGEIGDKRIVPKLVLLLDDHDPSVRKQVARSLGVLASRPSLGYLSARILREENLEVKHDLQEAIERIKGIR